MALFKHLFRSSSAFDNIIFQPVFKMFANTFFRNSNRSLLKSLFTDEYSCYRYKLFQLGKNQKAQSSNQLIISFPFTRQSNKYSFILHCCLSAAVGVQLSHIQNENDESVQFNNIMGKAFNSITEEDFVKAEKHLHDALDIAQEKNYVHGIWLVYNIMAELALRRKQKEKAEKLLLQARQKLLARGVLPGDLKIAHISLNLGHIYELLKSYKKAEANYQFCYDLVRKHIENMKIVPLDTLMLWVNILNNFGIFLIKQGQQMKGSSGVSQLNKGITHLRQAVDTYTLMKGKGNELTSYMLSDVSPIFGIVIKDPDNVKDTDNAIDHLEKAAELGDKLPRMPVLSHVYINLGLGYLIKGLYDESTDACQEGLKKAKENNDTQAIIYANACLHDISQYFKKKS